MARLVTISKMTHATYPITKMKKRTETSRKMIEIEQPTYVMIVRALFSTFC